MRKPRRTSSTSLSDSQLVLLDFTFRWDVDVRWLRHEVCREYLNVEYSHDLSDEALDALLDDLVGSGLMHVSASGGERVYGLTEEGGRLWELGLETARRYFRATRLIHFKETLEPPPPQELPDHALLPWKRFPRIYRLRLERAQEEPRGADWEAYEREREWWINLRELKTCQLLDGRDQP